MLKDNELSELLIAKFSHDIAGAIGAISNGTEFLKDEDHTMRERACELIETSAKQAVARLNYFRQAFGITYDNGDANLSEIRNLIHHYLHTSKVSLLWGDENLNLPGFFINHKTGKIILNVILLLYGSLVYGGTIEIKLLKTTNGKRIIFTATGKNIKLEDETTNILNTNFTKVKLTPRNIHIYYMVTLLTDKNTKLAIEKQDNNLNLIIDI